MRRGLRDSGNDEQQKWMRRKVVVFGEDDWQQWKRWLVMVSLDQGIVMMRHRL